MLYSQTLTFWKQEWICSLSLKNRLMLPKLAQSQILHWKFALVLLHPTATISVGLSEMGRYYLFSRFCICALLSLFILFAALQNFDLWLFSHFSSYYLIHEVQLRRAELYILGMGIVIDFHGVSSYVVF